MRGCLMLQLLYILSLPISLFHLTARQLVFVPQLLQVFLVIYFTQIHPIKPVSHIFILYPPYAHTILIDLQQDETTLEHTL